MLRSRRHPGLPETFGEGDADRGDLSGGHAVAAVGVGDRRAQSGNVEDGSDVDVDADVAEVATGHAAFAPDESRSPRADFFGRVEGAPSTRLTRPPSPVDQNQQRILFPGRTRDSLQRGGQAPGAPPLGRFSA